MSRIVWPAESLKALPSQLTNKGYLRCLPLRRWSVAKLAERVPGERPTSGSDEGNSEVKDFNHDLTPKKRKKVANATCPTTDFIVDPSTGPVRIISVVLVITFRQTGNT